MTRPSPLIFALALAPAVAHAGPLDDFALTPDPAYGYTLDATHAYKGFTVYDLTLTSQTWRSAEEVAETVWTHNLTIVAPANARTRTALLIVSGGSTGNGPPTIDPAIGAWAASSHSVVALVDQVPNQPLHFPDQAGGLSEDALLSYSMDKALVTGDLTWAALMPMTRSAVAAMDAVQSFMGADVPRAKRARIDDFVVAGASKRGWTTWLSAAVDPRVKAAVPMVIDVLDMGAQLDHHYRAYGFYSFALDDWEAWDLPCRLRSPEGAALLDVVDPFAYKDRLDMPTYSINATGDPFFLPDASTFYFHELPGLKHQRYVPNVGHGLEDIASVAPPALEYFDAIAEGDRLPRLSWTFEADGFIRVTTPDQPLAVRLWQATNPAARDFRRIDETSPVWTSTDVGPSADGSWQARAPVPPSGWTAYFIEVEFQSDDVAKPFSFTTDVRVVPDVLPFESDACE